MIGRTKRGHRLNWRPDLPDVRDHIFQADRTISLPPRADLRDGMPPVVDQGEEGSCTANALAGALGFLHGGPACVPYSRQWIYYQERAIEGDVKQDAGAEIRDGVKVVNKLGAPPETLWPYDRKHFAKKPTASVVKAAAKTKVTAYERIVSNDDRLNCLAQGMPFVLGFTCYENLDSDEVARTGVLGLPSKGEKVTGGHAVVAVGYDLAAKTYLVRNSWGPSWGQQGHFTMPFAYVDDPNLADDMWVLRA